MANLSGFQLAVTTRLGEWSDSQHMTYASSHIFDRVPALSFVEPQATITSWFHQAATGDGEAV